MLFSGVCPLHFGCGFRDRTDNCLQAAKQSRRKSLEEILPRIKAKHSQRSFKSFRLNRNTIKTPLPPVLHRTVCSCWPGITFPFPTGDALLFAAPYGSIPLDGSMQPAELHEFGTIPLSSCLLRRMPQGWELTLLPATGPLLQLRQPGFKRKTEFLYRKLELQPNETQASAQLPQQRRGRRTRPGVSGMRVHVAVCKRFWRARVVSGWVQDKSRKLEPSACARAAQSAQDPPSPAPQVKPACCRH